MGRDAGGGVCEVLPAGAGSWARLEHSSVAHIPGRWPAAPPGRPLQAMAAPRAQLPLASPRCKVGGTGRSTLVGAHRAYADAHGVQAAVPMGASPAGGVPRRCRGWGGATPRTPVPCWPNFMRTESLNLPVRPPAAPLMTNSQRKHGRWLHLGAPRWPRPPSPGDTGTGTATFPGLGRPAGRDGRTPGRGLGCAPV